MYSLEDSDFYSFCTLGTLDTSGGSSGSEYSPIKETDSTRRKLKKVRNYC